MCSHVRTAHLHADAVRMYAHVRGPPSARACQSSEVRCKELTCKERGGRRLVGPTAQPACRTGPLADWLRNTSAHQRHRHVELVRRAVTCAIGVMASCYASHWPCLAVRPLRHSLLGVCRLGVCRAQSSCLPLTSCGDSTALPCGQGHTAQAHAAMGAF